MPGRPITDEEMEVFEAIQDCVNMCLVQVQFDGQETAVICAYEVIDGVTEFEPLAILVTPEIIARITPPNA